MIPMRAILLFTLLAGIFISCQSKTEKKSVKTAQQALTNNAVVDNMGADKIFNEKLTVILVEEPDSNSSSLHLQDYVMNGVSFIPVFTSKEEFTASTGGVDIMKPLMEVNGMVFLSLLKGQEIIKVNPSLSNEKTFQASDLILKYQTRVDSVKNKLKALEDEINKNDKL